MNSVFSSWLVMMMIDECPTFQDLVMALGPEGADNYVLGLVFYGEEI